MKSLFLLISLSLCFSLSAQRSPQELGLESINRSKAEEVIGYLASDDLFGREAGTKYAELSAKYIKKELKKIGIKPLDGEYLHKFKTKGWTLDGKVKMRLLSDTSNFGLGKYEKIYTLNNVLGVIEGVNRDEFVVIGAHYDHLGVDLTLEGDQIYNGADDNASGVAAVIQIAKAFVESGVKPQRSVIFAFWDGEEKGLLGSREFVERYKSIENVKGYLNFDMIGRNNNESKPKGVVYFYTAAHPEFGQWLKDDIIKYDLKLEPDYRAWDKPTAGSDNVHFAKRGIPIIWYHTDGHPDYHKPGDEVEKLNWEKMVDITKASFLNFWNMANIE